MTSQAENRKTLKRVLFVIMHEYMFKTNGSRINLVNVSKEKCYITDGLGVGISACDVTGSFPSPLTSYYR